MMNCYARWTEDKENNLFFRDQTILQFGSSWDLIANIISLNPGSATPKNDININDFLLSKKLPYFINPNEDQNYYEFKLDPFMRNILKCFSKHYNGGIIKIYNLFNLKNQDSKKAMEEYYENKQNKFIHTNIDDINYENKPLIIATGDGGLKDGLIDELKKYINHSEKEKLYSIQKIKDKEFSILKDEVNSEGLIYSYHPSYTFNYGNKTICQKL